MRALYFYAQIYVRNQKYNAVWQVNKSTRTLTTDFRQLLIVGRWVVTCYFKGIETLLADYPDHKDLAQVLYWLGNDYRRMKQTAEARDCYQYAADFNGDGIVNLLDYQKFSKYWLNE